MAGIGISEIAVIFLLVLIFVGPDKLPGVARTVGRAMGEVRRVKDGLKMSLLVEDPGLRPTPRTPLHAQRREQRRRTPEGPPTLLDVADDGTDHPEGR